MIKKVLFMLIVVLWSARGFAVVWLVNNQPGSERDFSSIQSAVEFASPNDTIVVKGSPINYGNVLLEKPLVLLGEGAFPESGVEHTTKLTRILFTSNPFRRTISSGSVIAGFEFPYFPGQRPNLVTIAHERTAIENITIERNWLWFVQVVGNAENWVFRNNIIRGWVNGGGNYDDNSGASGFIFQNNILSSLIGFTRGTLLVEHNVILGRLKDIHRATVVSNIFTRNEVLLSNVFSCQFKNNLSAGTKIGDENQYAHPTRFESKSLSSQLFNSGSGNKTGLNPGFSYWPVDDIMGGAAFRLLSSSPARKLGGSEAGIFGGKFPFPVDAFKFQQIEDPFPSFVTNIF
jgi:hypothetical protein